MLALGLARGRSLVSSGGLGKVWDLEDGGLGEGPLMALLRASVSSREGTMDGVVEYMRLVLECGSFNEVMF